MKSNKKFNTLIFILILVARMLFVVGFATVGARLSNVDTQLSDRKTVIKSTGGNDTLLIRNAIELSSNNILVFKAGTYFIDSPIVSTIKGNRKWIMEDNVIFKYTGSSNGIMLSILLNKFNFEINGNLTINCDNKAREGLKISNIVTRMTDAVNVTMTNVKAINVFSKTQNCGAVGISVNGGFTLVNLVRCGAINVSRGLGIGNPGISGSNGILISGNSSVSYPRQVLIYEPYLENITSLELDGNAKNLDCDGLSVLIPLDKAKVVMSDSRLFVNGGEYKNCRGRSIKSQVYNTKIDNPTFKRNSVKGIDNAREVDFQYGIGTLDNFKCVYDTLKDGTTPFGTSMAIVNSTLRNIPNGLGYVSIGKGEIINNVPPSFVLPYLFVFNATAQQFSQVKLSQIKHLGIGRFGRGVYGDTSKIKNLIFDECYFSRISTYLVQNTGKSTSNINVKNVVHGGDIIPITNGLVTLASQNNRGFTYKDSCKSDDIYIKRQIKSGK
jgi:hypothetical protein